MKQLQKLFSATLLPITSWILMASLATGCYSEVMICMDKAPCTCNNVANEYYFIDCSNTDLTTVQVMPQNNTMKFSMITFENAHLTELLRIEIYQYLHPFNVEMLNFGKNRITTIEKYAFDKHTALEALILKDNRLTTVDGDWFTGLTETLEVLDLSGNKIEFIPENAFKLLTLLEYLNLDRNQLKNINDFTFNGLQFLRELSLDYNPLRVVQGREFSAMSRLETISIQYTYMEHLPVFPKSMSMLKRIMLNGNFIVSVHSYQFANVPTVEDISLDKMPKLKYIEECAFCNLPRLVKLFMSDSPNVAKIDEKAFDPGFGFTNPVQILDFSNNSLTSLSSKLVHWQSAGAIYLAGNKWNCSCGIKWMTDGNVAANDVPRCFYPEALRNQPIKQLPSEMFANCYQKHVYAMSRFIIPMASSILFIVAALVLCSIWRARKADGRMSIQIKNAIRRPTKQQYAYNIVATGNGKAKDVMVNHDSLSWKLSPGVHGANTGKEQNV